MFNTHPAFMKLSLFAGLAFALPKNAQCQTFLSGQEVLHGLEAVYVVVADVTEDARRDGLSQQRLQTVTELALRSAGISVQSEENIRAKRRRNPKFRQAYLYVKVNAIKDGVLYAYHVDVELKEIIKLVDDSALAYGVIWDVGGIGRVGSNNLLDVVETVRRFVERFANDYLAANPRNR